MAQVGDKNASFQGTTMDPSVMVTELAEDVPTLTVATVIGVTVVVLIAIAIVFILGVLIDCRQQRLLEEKMGEVKRKSQRRVVSVPIDVEQDEANIVSNMEDSGISVPPAELLRSVP